MSDNLPPWANGYVARGVDPLDRPEVQRDSARELLDQVIAMIDRHCDCGAAHVVHATLDRRLRR